MSQKVTDVNIYPRFVFQEESTENYYLSSDYNFIKTLCNPEWDHFKIGDVFPLEGREVRITDIVVTLIGFINSHDWGAGPEPIGEKVPSNLDIKVYFEYIL